MAASEETTLGELVEAGLREILRQRSARGGPFRLRDASVGGNGLRPELRDAGWDRIRDALHDRRGG